MIEIIVHIVLLFSQFELIKLKELVYIFCKLKAIKSPFLFHSCCFVYNYLYLLKTLSVYILNSNFLKGE